MSIFYIGNAKNLNRYHLFLVIYLDALFYMIIAKPYIENDLTSAELSTR